MIEMTLEEVVEKYGSTVGQWKRGWKKQADKVSQKTDGRVMIVKIKGDIYGVEEREERPKNMFSMPKEEVRHLSMETLKLLSMEQVALLGVLFTPHRAFQGSYKEFLEYVGIDDNRNDNVEKLRSAFEVLNERSFIEYIPSDKPGYFVVGMNEGAKRDIGLTPERIEECRKVANAANMIGYKGWNDILRVWMVIDFMSSGNHGEDFYITNKEICDGTGLDERRVIQVKKALIDNQKMMSTQGFYINKAGNIRSAGTAYKLNVLERGNQLEQKEI